MDYGVSKAPALVRDLAGIPVEVPGQFHLVRSTDGAVISRKTVSGEYQQISPSEVANRIDPFIREGWVAPERGFLFHSGSYEVLSFRIDGGSLEDQGKVAGEDWTHFLSLHNWQGGGGKVRGSIHSHRIVCQNTAMLAARMASFAIPHSGKLSENLDVAFQTWNALKEQIRLISDRVQTWTNQEITAKEASEILHRVYGVKGKGPDDISTRTANEIEYALGEFANLNRGTYGKTLADVYNAVTATNTFYLPSKSKETPEKRLATLFDPAGSRNKLEAETVSILDSLVGV